MDPILCFNSLQLLSHSHSALFSALLHHLLSTFLHELLSAFLQELLPVFLNHLLPAFLHEMPSCETLLQPGFIHEWMHGSLCEILEDELLRDGPGLSELEELLEDERLLYLGAHVPAI